MGEKKYFGDVRQCTLKELTNSLHKGPRRSEECVSEEVEVPGLGRMIMWRLIEPNKDKD